MKKKEITKELVEKDYLKLKKILIDCYSKNEVENFMETLKLIGRLMYNFNIFYTDNDIEKIIKECSSKLDIDIKDQNKNKIVFYDYFSLDNRGLTEQYIESLIKLDYEILYITLQNNTSRMKNILEKLYSSEKNEVFFVENLLNLKSCDKIIKKVEAFKASKVFIHTSPWDSIGFITWSAFEKKLERYFINLTDHAFWLGKSTSDYFIEFRSYGKNISMDYRGIKEEKTIILPYYPIQNKKEKFQGFNFEYKNKKIIFSGGSLYKIYGSDIFFDIVKYILDTDEDTIFLYLGNGDEKPLKQFIELNAYQKRFYFENERKDINEIFKRCYFYLGTFPISGGLMSQLSVINNKLPIAYTSKDLPVNFIEELFVNVKDKKFTYTNLDEIKLEISKILTDQEYLNKKEHGVKTLIVSENEFKNELKNIIENKQSKFLCKRYKIDIKKFSELYFQQENNYLRNYYQVFLTKNIKVIFNFKSYFFKAIFKRISIEVLYKLNKLGK